MSRNTYKNVSSASKIKFSIRRKQKSYIHWRFLKDISIDIIGSLPRSNRMDAIVVIIDRFMKMIQLRATTMSISSERIANIYRDNIWKLHGVSRKILSD